MIFVATLLVFRLHKSGLWPWISWIFSATVFKFTAVVLAPGPRSGNVIHVVPGPDGARATVWVWAEEKCKITNLKAINQVSQLSRHVSRDCHECQAVTCDTYLVRVRSLMVRDGLDTPGARALLILDLILTENKIKSCSNFIVFENWHLM